MTVDAKAELSAYDRSSAPRIVVVGSINMDLVARMERLPKPGETVSGTSFQMIPGGKGANQAVAAARLGAQVAIIARVGDDSFGETLKKNLIAEGIEASHIFSTPNCSTGVALINVDLMATNSITVIPGANGQLTPQDIESCRGTIESADALLVQLETPIETGIAAIEIAQRNGVITILDPAPAPSHRLPLELMSVDYISPNQTEAAALTGITVIDWDSATAAAKEMHRCGAKTIVLKMGEYGALILPREGNSVQVHAPEITAVDTTAAGDAFTAALAVGLSEGKSLYEATKMAVVAGSLACTRFGAQPSMPFRDDLDKWQTQSST